MAESVSVARCELAAQKAERSPTPSAGEEQVIQLFDEFRGRVLRYLLGFGLPVQDGEEVVQEVFLALFQHLLKGSPRENLSGWVFRVAHNLGLKRRRAGTREATGAQADGAAANRADPADNPEEQFLHRQRQNRLQAVLRALPEQDRWCLCLRAEGLRYREIAVVLDIPLASVSASLGRSLARLSRADAR
jgi:RNA polymerase sigma-70 factor (ECF subfamily)